VQLPSRELGAFLAAEMTLSENCGEDNGGGLSPFVMGMATGVLL
jgi:hypothetical protein